MHCCRLTSPSDRGVGRALSFHPGVVALAPQLSPQAVVVDTPGCHTSPFFKSQQPLSLQSLGKHLSD